MSVRRTQGASEMGDTRAERRGTGFAGPLGLPP